MSFLETLLRDDEKVKRLNAAEDPVKEAIAMGATEEDLEPIDENKYSPIKRWEILSRIRFESVRSICVLGDAYSDTVTASMCDEEKKWGLGQWRSARNL